MCGNPGVCQRESVRADSGVCAFAWHQCFSVFLGITVFWGGEHVSVDGVDAL